MLYMDYPCVFLTFTYVNSYSRSIFFDLHFKNAFILGLPWWSSV